MKQRADMFTAEQIEVIREMHANGFGAGAIGKALGRSPGSVRAKCANSLDLKFPRGKPVAGARFKVADRHWPPLSVEAGERGMTVSRLVMQLVETIIEDRLFDAMLGPKTKAKANVRAIAAISGAELGRNGTGETRDTGRRAGPHLPDGSPPIPPVPLSTLQPVLAASLTPTFEVRVRI
jgi:hypothetical protein